MSSANPPQGPNGTQPMHQAVAEPATPAEAATPVSGAPEAPVAPETVPPNEAMRERLLTPEETESLLRGQTPLREDALNPVGTVEEEQAQLAGDHFASIPADPSLEPTPAAPPPPQAPTATPTPAQAAAVQAQLPVAPVAPVAPAQVQATPAEAALQAQNTMLQQSLAAMQGQMTQLQQAQPAAAAPQAQQQQQQQQAPRFNFNVPPGHMQALNAEDPATRQAALDSLLSGVANSVYAQVQTDMEERFQTQVPQTVAAHMGAAQQREAVSRDMYGTYPELNAHSNLVFATAEQLQGQGLGAAGWTPDFRDMIAERLSPMVPGLAQKVQAQRAQRLAATNFPTQVPGALPPTLPPGSVAGGVHGPQPSQTVLMRNASGQIVPMVPQAALAGPQARPGVGVGVDPAVQDIWNTLGY